MGAFAAPPRLAPCAGDLAWNLERRRGPAERLAHRSHLVGAERRAMRGVRALLVGGALADDRPAGDQRRARIGQRLVIGAAHVVGVMAVAARDVPAISGIARLDILRGRKIGGAIDGDPVVVPDHVQPAEAKMAGQARGLVIDALHQAAVAGDHPGAVIDELIAIFGVQVPLGDRHADRHRHALPQRPGRRLDARRAGNSPDGRRTGCPACGNS